MVTVTVGNGDLMRKMREKRTVEFELKLAFEAHEVIAYKLLYLI